MMPFGSILAHAKGRSGIYLETADGIGFTVGRVSLARLTLLIFGIPHMGLRIRARALLKAIVKGTPSGGDSRILDLGCGFGVYSIELAHRGTANIIAADLDRQRVLAARRTAQDLDLPCQFIVADAQHLPFQAGVFDSVLFTEVLEHIPDDKGALQEVSRVLDESGNVYLSTPGDLGFVASIEDMGHERSGYSRDELTAILAGAGLSPSAIDPCGLPFGSLAWRANRKLLMSLPLSAPLLVMTFYPLFAFTLFDRLVAKIESQRRKPLFWILKAGKSHGPANQLQ